jgi:hypothetical protein
MIEGGGNPRARLLLLRFLNPLQRMDFEQFGRFIVYGPQRSKRKRRMYLVEKGGVSEIAELRRYAPTWFRDYSFKDRGYEVLDDFCVVEATNDALPICDLMLTWKLMIEGDERKFRRIGHSNA